MRHAYYQDLMFFNGSSWDRYFPARSDERIDYDVIVVGSGMGGGILADATSDRGLKTLVLEAGPVRHLVNITDLPLPNVVEAMNPYELEGDTDLRGGVSFNLGGRSIFWSAVIPRLREWELKYWPEPIANYLRSSGYDLAERLFRKRTQYPPFQDGLLERFKTEFSNFEVTHLPRSYHQPGFGPNARSGSPDERTTGVFSTAALLSNSLSNSGKAGADNLHVALEHVVEQIEFTGRKATAVTVLDLKNGVRRRYRGKSIILAAGTTESPRIAMTSNLPDKSGLIGIGLTDHQEADLQFEIPSDCSFFGPNDQGNLFLRPLDQNSDRFSCELALNWKFWDVRLEDDDVWAQRYASSTSATSTIKFLFRRALNNANSITLRGDRTYVSLEGMEDQPFRSELESLSQQIVGMFGGKALTGLTYNSHSVTFHLGGSMRMGAHGLGVVDTDLRFHEFDNLFCCDLSVFPDIPASNPSLTLGALALRLAALLPQPSLTCEDTGRSA